MGQQPADSDSPQVVVVEVTVRSHGESRESSVGARGDGGGVARRVVLAVGAIGVLATIVVIWLAGGSGRHGDPLTARGPNGVAAAYGYPLGCLSVTILPTERTYARADLSHTTGCGRITGYAPAIFHYAAGRWRLVPDAVGYMCLAGAVPAVVARELDLCVGTIGQGCVRIGQPEQGRPATPLGRPCAKLPEIAGVV